MQGIQILSLFIGFISFIIGYGLYLYIKKEDIERKKYASYNMLIVYLKYCLEYLGLIIIFLVLAYIIYRG